jgi:hypothetical protein
MSSRTLAAEGSGTVDLEQDDGTSSIRPRRVGEGPWTPPDQNGVAAG